MEIQDKRIYFWPSPNTCIIKLQYWWSRTVESETIKRVAVCVCSMTWIWGARHASY